MTNTWLSHYATDLSQAVESFREKANAYQSRLEEAEIARAKSSRAEAHGTRPPLCDRFANADEPQHDVLWRMRRRHSQRLMMVDRLRKTNFRPSNNAYKRLKPGLTMKVENHPSSITCVNSLPKRLKMSGDSIDKISKSVIRPSSRRRRDIKVSIRDQGPPPRN